MLFEIMGKIEKKIKKINERIFFLEEELRISLTKKSSSSSEIDVGSYQRQISELRKQLSTMIE